MYIQRALESEPEMPLRTPMRPKSPRRSALTAALATALAVLPGACAGPSANSDLSSVGNAGLTGDFRRVHDPAIIREGDTWHLFATGHAGSPTGIVPWRTSKDLAHWTYKGPVFSALPAWTNARIPGAKGLWAPDIVFSGSEYRLYYSVSTFGKNHSAIGLATTPTLDPADPRFGWTDQGMVVESRIEDDFNAIDPNVLVDRDGSHWMAFGSFWSGIKMVRLDPATGKPPAGEAGIHALASRPPPGAVEAPFLIERGGFYYLFVSFDFCCRAAKSSYYTVVGRSRTPTGPYVDREGRPMLEGGGSIVLHSDSDASGRWRGPGHVAIVREPQRDYIVYHAYDTRDRGRPALRIQPLGWTADGWPVAL